MQKKCMVGLFQCGEGIPSASENRFPAGKTSTPTKSNTNSLFPVVLALIAATMGLLPAQAIDPIKELRAADKTQWTVTIAPKAEGKPGKDAKSKEKDASHPAKPPARALVQSIGAKDGGIYRVLNQYNDQTAEEWWIISHYQHFKINGQQKIARLLSSQNRAWNLEQSDFPELYWAVGQSPQIQDIEGKKMLVIKMDASKKPLSKRQQRDLEELRQAMNQSGETMEVPPQLSVSGTLVLYLNPETRMPVRFEDIDRIYSYSFAPSPNLRSVISEDFKKEIADFEKNLSELTRPPSSPKVRNRRNQAP
jgi:hypothetical protein